MRLLQLTSVDSEGAVSWCAALQHTWHLAALIFTACSEE